MQFDCVMAFAHQYDENEDNDCDDYYCYDDIPKDSIVFSLGQVHDTSSGLSNLYMK